MRNVLLSINTTSSPRRRSLDSGKDGLELSIEAPHELGRGPCHLDEPLEGQEVDDVGVGEPGQRSRFSSMI